MYTAVERIGSKVNQKTSAEKKVVKQISENPLSKPESCSAHSKMRFAGHLHDSNSAVKKFDTDPAHIGRRLQNVIWRGWWNRTKVNFKSEDLVRILSIKEQRLNDNTFHQKVAGANILDITKMFAVKFNTKETQDASSNAQKTEVRKTSDSFVTNGVADTKAVGSDVVGVNIVEANKVLKSTLVPSIVEESAVGETTGGKYFSSQIEIQPTLVCASNEVSDGFTRYFVPSLQLHELPVVGTFIDKHVSPGFAYRVRRNGTDEYLFDGNALVLESVGQGYGKRLTFESEDLLENDNYFWSDSNEDGFAFSIQAVSDGDEFAVYDCKNVQIASATIKEAFKEQVIESTGIDGNGVVKNIQVKFNCAVRFWNNGNVPSNLLGDTKEFLLCGKATVIKKIGDYRAKTTAIKEVQVENIGICTMLTKCT